MLLKIVFSSLFFCVLSATSFPNLIWTQTCTIPIGRDNITFQNSFIQHKYKTEDVFFSACKDLSQIGCDKESFGCLLRGDEIINFINKTEETSDYFRLKSEGGYLFDVKINLRSPKYTLNVKSKNLYELELDPHFKENCTKTIPNGRNLFLNDLYQRDIFMESKEHEVHLNLCETTPLKCPNDASICLINKKTNQSTEWGKMDHLSIDDNSGNLVFNYKTKKKGGLHSSIILKCNWTTSLGAKSFQIVNTNKLEVVIESNLGCSKNDLKCVFTDDIYTYDFSKLSHFNGTKLIGYKKGELKLNICGPLMSHKTCFDQKSQICLFDHDLNYGSIPTPVKIENDIIKFTIKDGSQCPKNSTVNLQTIFELHCSSIEEGPKLIKENDCSLEIQWKTPKACPKANSAVGRLSYQINRSCSIQHGDKTYDLTMLSRSKSNHVAKSGEIEFLINVCRAIVHEDDMGCNEYMAMCLRNRSEPNIKRRFFSLGSVRSPEYKNGQLILEYKNGYFDKNCFRDASAIIYFNCSKDREIEPTFLKHENCRYEFQWNTKYACPNEIDCVKKDNLDNSISFENVKSTSIQIKSEFKVYTIDICKDQFITTDLSKNEKHEFNVFANVQTNENGTFLKYKLAKSCRDKTDFDEIKIELDCEPLLNNDHYEGITISNCLLYLKLKHNDFCAFTPTTLKTITYEEKISINKEKIYHYNIEPKIIDCTIRFNSKDIHLNTLPPLTVKSPNKKFNYANYTIGSNSTSVCYPHFICKENKPLVTLKECPNVTTEKNGLKLMFNSTFGNKSEIFFYCNTNEEESLPIVTLELKDFVSFRYPLKTICDYENLSEGTSSLLIIGIVVCVIIICLGGVILYNRRFLRRLCNKDKSNTYVYCKNSEL
ncbi:uncharacterized protein [Onthophagus taurus]|uniref:uncharacterized protein n=1 Tax=Onthophagus taurus TaxID=166361 RepID=UPI0039BEC2BE